jgi:hypothetical protein
MNESMYPLDFSRRVLVLLRRARTALQHAPRRVDEVLQRVAHVDELLHGAHPVAVHVPSNPRGVVGKGVDPLARGQAVHARDHHVLGAAGGAAVLVGDLEGVVVLEEVVVAAHVGHHQLLVGERIALQQVGHAGVVVDHHLVDA